MDRYYSCCAASQEKKLQHELLSKHKQNLTKWPVKLWKLPDALLIQYKQFLGKHFKPMTDCASLSNLKIFTSFWGIRYNMRLYNNRDKLTLVHVCISVYWVILGRLEITDFEDAKVLLCVSAINQYPIKLIMSHHSASRRRWARGWARALWPRRWFQLPCNVKTLVKTCSFKYLGKNKITQLRSHHILCWPKKRGQRSHESSFFLSLNLRPRFSGNVWVCTVQIGYGY